MLMFFAPLLKYNILLIPLTGLLRHTHIHTHTKTHIHTSYLFPIGAACSSRQYLSRPSGPSGALIRSHLLSATVITPSGPPPIPISRYTMMKRPTQDIGVYACCFPGDGRPLEDVGEVGVSQLETDVLVSTILLLLLTTPNTNTHTCADMLHSSCSGKYSKAPSASNMTSSEQSTG